MTDNYGQISKYTKTHRSDECGVAIISEKLVVKHGDLFIFQPHGEQDNTPDTDGFLRLRKKELELTPRSQKLGWNLPKTFFYQQKVTNKCIKNNKYSCEKKVVKYCFESNLPTLLFVVDTSGSKPVIYWYHFGASEFAIYREKLEEDGEKPIVLKNMHRLFTDEEVFAMYNFLYGLGVKDELNELSAEVRTAVIATRDIQCALGSIIYLLHPFNIKNAVDIFYDVLANSGNKRVYTKKFIEITLAEMCASGALEKENGLYLLPKQGIREETEEGDIRGRDVGVRLLNHGLQLIDLEYIESTHVRDISTFYDRLTVTSHPNATEFLDRKINEISEDI